MESKKADAGIPVTSWSLSAKLSLLAVFGYSDSDSTSLLTHTLTILHRCSIVSVLVRSISRVLGWRFNKSTTPGVLLIPTAAGIVVLDFGLASIGAHVARLRDSVLDTGIGTTAELQFGLGGVALSLSASDPFSATATVAEPSAGVPEPGASGEGNATAV